MKTAKTCTVQRLLEGKFVSSEDTVPVEKELPLYVNGEHLATASVLPSLEQEFVVGYLFGQGFIRNATEIERLEITGEGAEVVLAGTDALWTRGPGTSYRIVSGGGRTAYFESNTYSRITSDLTVSKKDIFRAMNTLFEKAELYLITKGVHSSALFDSESRLVCIAEDIGRHNTLDKVIGYALLNGVECSRTFMVSTGRMASEMVTKICRAGIPLVATKTAVTDQGLDIAERYGTTLIGFVRDIGTKMHTDMETRVFTEARMNIYTGRERVL